MSSLISAAHAPLEISWFKARGMYLILNLFNGLCNGLPQDNYIQCRENPMILMEMKEEERDSGK